jgi:hypothetical protein
MLDFFFFYFFVEDISACNRSWRLNMQNGSVLRRSRKNHSDIWQFRWWEKTSEGKRIYRRREIGTVDQIPDLEAARKAVCLLVPKLNARRVRSEPTSMTVGGDLE